MYKIIDPIRSKVIAHEVNNKPSLQHDENQQDNW